MYAHLASRLSTFPRNRRGVTAVEFGLVAPFFLAAVLAWIEMGLCLFMSATLDNAVRDASRLIRIGTATEASFKSAICARTSALMPCSGISYKVQSGLTFAGLSAVSAASGTFASTGFNAGGSGSDVLVQVGYQKTALAGPLLTPFGFGGSILISTTLAFQNEDY